MHRICIRTASKCALFALLPVLVMIFTLATADRAFAHRVNIFAWTEGDQIIAECGFNGGNKVKQGQIAVYDAATGAKLLEGKTDDGGDFRFPIPAEGKAHGLRLVVKAGEGHQNEWTMEAAELTSVQASAQPAVATATTAAAGPSPAQASPAGKPQTGAQAVGTAAAGLSAAEVQSIVNASLDAKLGPIRKELAEMRVARPGFTEIFGGIGWLVGLAGVALYFKGRRG